MSEKDEEKKQAEKAATDELANQTKTEGNEAERSAKMRGDAERKLQELQR